MTTKRPDESQTEFTVRVVREEAQREVLAEFAGHCSGPADRHGNSGC